MKFIVLEDAVGMRIDRYLVLQPQKWSRSFIQKLVKESFVFINGKAIKNNAKLKIGDKVLVRVPPVDSLELEPADIALSIVYEDKDLLVVDKPAGMVVHPGTHGSHSQDSLVNALLYHCKDQLSGINGVMRPGIIHRLDKDTSGLLVVAKNDNAHKGLTEEFKSRNVEKIYYALLVGKIHPLRGTIDAPIGRDSRDRKKMAVVKNRFGKAALTRYEVVQYYEDYSFVKIELLTGRTHQIRVHFSSIGYPLVGDNLYGKHSVNKKFAQDFGLERQFLHAAHLTFLHPITQKKVECESSLPFDLKTVLDKLKQH